MIGRVLTVVALACIGLYRYGIRPLIGPRCRFFPSCSEYGQQALQAHGFVHGSLLTVQRLARCHPWHPGGLDPVPEVLASASQRVRWRYLGSCTNPSCAPPAVDDAVCSSGNATQHPNTPFSSHSTS